MKRIIALLLLLFLALSTVAGNLIFNPGFEMGTAGFGLYRLLRPDTNPNLEFRPLEIDAASPFEGKNALKLTNPGGEYYHLRSREFPLAPKTRYVFQGAMRSSVPGYRLRLHVLNVDKDGKWSIHGQTFALQTQWQTFTFEFETELGGPYLCYFFNLEKEVPAGDVWFDALSVTEKNVPAEAGKLAAAVLFDEPLHTLTPGAKASLRVVLHNPGKAALEKQLALQVTDDESGAQLASIPHAFSLTPGEAKAFPLELPLERFGTFTVTPVAEFPLDVLPGHLAVIGSYTARPLDFTRDFCVGVNGSGNHIPNNTSGGYAAYNAPYEALYRQLERIGCRILRDHSTGTKLTSWAKMEPEKGRFDFSHFDRVLAVCEKYGLTVLPCFGRVYGKLGAWEADIYPEWLKPELIRVKENPRGTNPKFIIDLPPEAEWRRYIAAFVKHAGNRIPAYEVMNEPNLNLSAETYVGLLKPAYETIKAVNPAATVLGICVTGDFDRELRNFTEECVRLGALKSLDAVSFHPYNARELASIMPADRQIDELKEIIGDVPLYNTEIFYLFDTTERNHSAQRKITPSHAAARFLTDLGEGVRQSISIDQYQLWRQPLHPGHHRTTELIPNGVCVAYNALARHFEGAKPTVKFRLAHGVIAYQYERDGKPLAAVWNYEKRAGIRADFTGLEVLDLFGNPATAGILPVTGSPLYLFPGKLSDAEFRARLEKLEPRTEEPLTVTPLVRVFREENALTAIVNLRNETDRAVSGFAGLTGSFIALERHPFTVPANSSLTLEIPVSATESAQTTVGIYADGRLRHTPVETVVNPVLASGKSFRIAGPDGVPSAVGTATFVDKRLTLEFEVTDPTDAGPSGERHPWETDSIELFFDAAPTAIPVLHPERYTRETVRVFITPRDPAEKQLTLWSETLKPEDFSFTCRTSRAGYQIRLELPLTPSGHYLGFEAKINDAETKRSASWCGAPLTYKNRTDFGILKIRAAAVIPASDNLFSDGGFESGLSEWKPDYGQPSFAARRIPSPDFLAGRYCLELELSPEREVKIVSPRLPVTPGKTAELRFWAKASEPAVLDAVINTWSPKHSGKHAYKRQSFRIDGEWRQYTLRYQLPADLATYPDLADRLAKVQFIGEKREGVKILLDDLEFFGSLE